MIRVWKNMFAPINKIPPEILALIPDFWNMHKRDQDIIALTHVCRAWRELFVSRSSLWTDFDCLDENKTPVYLERSNSSPISLSLDLSLGISSCASFFQIIPHATGRLKSLSIEGPSEDLEVVISHLSHPAPLLNHLSIRLSPGHVPDRYPALSFALFNGDLSSLRTLCLESVHTELPWRNMVNLTSFTLYYTPPEVVSVKLLLDFFENAPYLEEVGLYFVTLTAGAQDSRLVSLACLKSMRIEDNNPASVLLDHLLIPVGAKLEIQADMLSSLIGVHLPRSLDNLKNLTNFTTIQLHPGGPSPGMKFSGPDGQVKITLTIHCPTGSLLESLGELNTSNTERLGIDSGDLPTGDALYRALIPMKALRTLTFSRCTNPDIFIHALQPATSSSGVVVCPKLEELVLVLHPYEKMSPITSIIEMVVARASRGEKLRTVRIIGGCGTADPDVLKLRKHVWNVEYYPEV